MIILVVIIDRNNFIYKGPRNRVTPLFSFSHWQKFSMWGKLLPTPRLETITAVLKRYPV